MIKIHGNIHRRKNSKYKSIGKLIFINILYLLFFKVIILLS